MDYIPGVLIFRVHRGYRSYKSDILTGSIITRVDNKEVNNLDDLQAIAKRINVGKRTVPVLLVDPGGSIEYKAIRP